MDDFKKSYKTFHKELRTFLKRVPRKIEKDCPKKEIIKHVKVIPRVLPAKDKAFKRGDVQLAQKKFRVLVMVTRLVLEALVCLVKARHNQWRERKSARLGQHMDKLEADFRGIRPPVQVISSGIGGTNQGPRKPKASIKPKVLQKVKLLATGLKEGECEEICQACDELGHDQCSGH